MRRQTGIVRALAFVAAATATFGVPVQHVAHAKSEVRLVIGTGPGGSYDAIGRLVGRHMGKYLLGTPNIVPQNMPGAGGLVTANYMFNRVAQDGDTFAVIPPEIILNQLFGDKNVLFDASKFNWIGNAVGSAVVVVVMNNAPVRSWKEATQTVSLMGATGPSGPDAIIARLANGTLGTKFNIITGYKSGHDISLAMERGEVHGRGAQSWSGWKAANPDWVASKRIIPLFQIAATPIPDLLDTPTLISIVDDSNRALVRAYTSIVALNRPFLTGPSVPRERVEELRRAFDETMKDKQFVTEANVAQIELGPISGSAIENMTREALSLEPALVKKLQSLVNP